MKERIAHGDPEDDSERLKEFERNQQILFNIVSKIIRTRRGEMGHGEQLEEIPFVDSLLQNYSSEDEVGTGSVLQCVGNIKDTACSRSTEKPSSNFQI